jgi:hypothetical protein
MPATIKSMSPEMRRSCASRARGIRTSMCITPIHANKKKKALALFAFISVHLRKSFTNCRGHGPLLQY